MTAAATAGPRARYPEPSPPPTGEHVPSLPVIIGGFLGATALVDGTLAAVIGSLVILATQGWGPAWIATAMAIGLASGARWRLRVDVDGIVYTRISAWIIPVRRARYLLDARVELYEAWEDPQPTGVCLVPLVSGEGARDECFWSGRSEIDPLGRSEIDPPSGSFALRLGCPLRQARRALFGRHCAADVVVILR
jgi:hypothetical protein